MSEAKRLAQDAMVQEYKHIRGLLAALVAQRGGYVLLSASDSIKHTLSIRDNDDGSITLMSSERE